MPQRLAINQPHSKPAAMKLGALASGNQLMSRARMAHDPEKWEPVFGKDHAQTEN
jgi:hypothetical protein